MVLLHWHPLQTLAGWSQVAWKERSEYGESENLLRRWKHRLKSTEIEYGAFKSHQQTYKLFLAVRMGLASSGIWRPSQEISAFSSQLSSNRSVTIQTKDKSSPPDQTEKSLTGASLMAAPLDTWKDQKMVKLIHSQFPRNTKWFFFKSHVKKQRWKLFLVRRGRQSLENVGLRWRPFCLLWNRTRRSYQQSNFLPLLTNKRRLLFWTDCYCSKSKVCSDCGQWRSNRHVENTWWDERKRL